MVITEGSNERSPNRLHKFGGIMVLISSGLLFLNAIYPMLEEQIYNVTGLKFGFALFLMFYITYMFGTIIALFKSISGVENLKDYKEHPRYKWKVVSSILNLISTELMFFLGIVLLLFSCIIKSSAITYLDAYTDAMLTLLIINEGVEMYGNKKHSKKD